MAPNLFNRDALQDSMESISRETEIGAPLNVSASKTTFRKTEPKADCDGLGQSRRAAVGGRAGAAVFSGTAFQKADFKADCGGWGQSRRDGLGRAAHGGLGETDTRWFGAE